MTDLHLMLLSALQGLTEFLPVSSSGHLILFSKFTTFPDQGLAFDVAVHVGSIIAVMIYFSETIWEMLKGVAKTYFIPNLKTPGSKLAWLIVIGTIPAVIAGLFLVENGTDELRSARERALDLLSAAEQTSGTLRQKLLRWYGEEAVEAAVLRMEELELINDLDYGRRYAADAVNLRGWPRRRIAMELQKKGVPAEVIEEALADITEETEIETACRLLEGPYRGKLRDRKERDKVKAALQRRGFSYEVIRQAVSRTLEALPEGGETPEPEETPETGDGQEELLALIRKKYAKNMADRAGMEKTIAALYRRGYPLEAIKAAMNTILEQEENCRDD